MAGTCSVPGCGAAAEHRCHSCGARLCREHTRTEGHDDVCLLCEARPASEPPMAGSKIRILDGGTSVYASPDPRGSKVARFAGGLEVDVTEEAGDFLQVTSFGAKGYIPRSAAGPLGIGRSTDAEDVRRREWRRYRAVLKGPSEERHPWHQTWWASLVWSFLPIMSWYALYIFGWKLAWNERGKYFLALAGLWAVIVVVAWAVEPFWN